MVDGTGRVAWGGAEGSTVMVAVGETDSADITLNSGKVTMAVDGTGRAVGGGRDIVLDKLLKAMLEKSSSSIIKSSSASLSLKLSLWWTLFRCFKMLYLYFEVLLQPIVGQE